MSAPGTITPAQIETERRRGVEDALDGRTPQLDSAEYLKGYATGERHANFLRELYSEERAS